MEWRAVLSHAEAAQTLRRAGYSQDQIEDVLQPLPDPIDTARDGEALQEQGLSAGILLERMAPASLAAG